MLFRKSISTERIPHIDDSTIPDNLFNSFHNDFFVIFAYFVEIVRNQQWTIRQWINNILGALQWVPENCKHKMSSEARPSTKHKSVGSWHGGTFSKQKYHQFGFRLFGSPHLGPNWLPLGWRFLHVRNRKPEVFSELWLWKAIWVSTFLEPIKRRQKNYWITVEDVI